MDKAGSSYNPVQEYNGIIIDYSRDKDIPEQGLALLTRKGFYKKDHEVSPQQTFARASTSYCFGDYEFAQRIYDYASKGWFTFASPVQSNAEDILWPTFSETEFEEAAEWLADNVVPDGMPISCFLAEIQDTRDSLVETRKEVSWLSMMGGGIGVGAGNRSPDEKSTGVMAHLRGYDADCLSYKQTESRRGSMVAYLDIDHPEITSFLEMRNPVGGDQNKKCFNLNNAVSIPDSFMHSVIKDEEYELIDPKHGATGRFLNAREVFERILELRYETGEPYIMFKDTVNRNIPEWITRPLYSVNQSNLCVAPETMILHRGGYTPIEELEGSDIEVWNGEEFTSTKVVRTSDNSKLIKVITSSGQELECTEYHKFYVKEDYNTPAVEKRAGDLEVGDKLIKFALPVIQGTKQLHKAYQNGFFSGDGCLVGGKSRIYLYHGKRDLEHVFELQQRTEQASCKRVYGYEEGLKDKFFVPASEYDIQSRLGWFAGLCDADGTISRNGTNESLQVCSTEKEFLKEAQLMLQTLGVSAKVTKCHEEGVRMLPANDGTGDLKPYDCRATYRLLVPSTGLYKLSALGFTCRRLEWVVRKPQRDAEQFIKVTSVVDNGREDKTYCFKEANRGMGMFGGILTGQCSEITLMTSETRTAVCCLSSINLEKFEEWKDTNIVQDLVRLLDNVLEYFIQLAPPQLSRAIYSASKERAIGLGTLGWHSYLQSKGIPFESVGFNSAVHHTNHVYGKIKAAAVEESLRLATLRGEPDDCLGSGMRNSHLMAVAPNASSSSLIGVSPSIEPWNANAFTAQGRAGSFLIKNKHLEAELEKLGLNTKDMWKRILMDDGSVQGIPEIPDHVKVLYKTAREIEQMYIVIQGGERQGHICQSQSLNIFVGSDVSLQEMVDLHIQGWVAGLKTFYYCRAAPSTKANLGTGGDKPLNSVPVVMKVESTECVACEG